MSLAAMIPNYDSEVDRLLQYGPSGFVLAFNLTFRGPEHLHSAYPEEWVKLYQDRNYFFLDPINFWTFSHIGEKRWSEIKLPDVRGVMAEAKKYGLVYGAIFSRKRNDKKSLLSVARADRELTDLEIEIIGAKFDGWIDMVVGRTLLTDGELDVLRALRDGLDRQEIAARLGMSESGVKQRGVKACSKLNAKTLTQAVAIAVARNYFDN